MGVSRVLYPLNVSRYCRESGCDRRRCGIAKKHGRRLRIYWNNFIFLSVQLKSLSTTIIVFLCDRFSLDDRGPLARKTIRTSRCSVVHCSFLLSFMYFVTVCGVAAFPRITFLLSVQHLLLWRLSWPERGAPASFLLETFCYIFEQLPFRGSPFKLSKLRQTRVTQ